MKPRKKRIAPIVVMIIFLALAAALIYFLFRAASNQTVYDTPSISEIFNDKSGDKSGSAQTAEVSEAEKKAAESVIIDTPTPTPEPTPTEAPAVVTTVSPDSLNSGNALMIRLSDGAVILDKASTERVYPASLTKLMTAIVVLDNLTDLDETFTMTSDIIDPYYLEGASLAGFEHGETVTIRDLLYGLLLPSGAEACEALVRRTAGDEASFVELMNAKAAELGLSDTHFTNATGLHDENHYSTCADLAVIMQEAVRNENIRSIICSPSYVCTPTDIHPEGLTLVSTLFYYLDTDIFENGAQILGGKTGTTDEAGRCLATLGSYDFDEYVTVTTQAPYGEDGSYLNIADAVNLYSSMQKAENV